MTGFPHGAASPTSVRSMSMMQQTAAGQAPVHANVASVQPLTTANTLGGTLPQRAVRFAESPQSIIGTQASLPQLSWQTTPIEATQGLIENKKDFAANATARPARPAAIDHAGVQSSSNTKPAGIFRRIGGRSRIPAPIRTARAGGPPGSGPRAIKTGSSPPYASTWEVANLQDTDVKADCEGRYNGHNQAQPRHQPLAAGDFNAPAPRLAGMPGAGSAAHEAPLAKTLAGLHAAGIDGRNMSRQDAARALTLAVVTGQALANAVEGTDDSVHAEYTIRSPASTSVVTEARNRRAAESAAASAAPFATPSATPPTVQPFAATHGSNRTFVPIAEAQRNAAKYGKPDYELNGRTPAATQGAAEALAAMAQPSRAQPHQARGGHSLFPTVTQDGSLVQRQYRIARKPVPGTAAAQSKTSGCQPRVVATASRRNAPLPPVPAPSPAETNFGDMMDQANRSYTPPGSPIGVIGQAITTDTLSGTPGLGISLVNGSPFDNAQESPSPQGTPTMPAPLWQRALSARRIDIEGSGLQLRYTTTSTAEPMRTPIYDQMRAEAIAAAPWTRPEGSLDTPTLDTGATFGSSETNATDSARGSIMVDTHVGPDATTWVARQRGSNSAQMEVELGASGWALMWYASELTSSVMRRE